MFTVCNFFVHAKLGGRPSQEVLACQTWTRGTLLHIAHGSRQTLWIALHQLDCHNYVGSRLMSPERTKQKGVSVSIACLPRVRVLRFQTV